MPAGLFTWSKKRKSENGLRSSSVGRRHKASPAAETCGFFLEFCLSFKKAVLKFRGQCNYTYAGGFFSTFARCRSWSLRLLAGAPVGEKTFLPLRHPLIAGETHHHAIFALSEHRSRRPVNPYPPRRKGRHGTDYLDPKPSPADPCWLGDRRQRSGSTATSASTHRRRAAQAGAQLSTLGRSPSSICFPAWSRRASGTESSYDLGGIRCHQRFSHQTGKSRFLYGEKR